MEMKMVYKPRPDFEELTAHAGMFGIQAIRKWMGFENLKRRAGMMKGQMNVHPPQPQADQLHFLCRYAL